MGVGFAGQRKVVFFPGQESLALIGEAEVLILLADADYRVSAEIGLFNLVEGMGVIALRKTGNQEFTFDFHMGKPPCCDCRLVDFTNYFYYFHFTIISFNSFPEK